MGTEIYYFSGTGNSFAVARDIAESINVKLIPVASVLNKGIIEWNNSYPIKEEAQ